MKYNISYIGDVMNTNIEVSFELDKSCAVYFNKKVQIQCMWIQHGDIMILMRTPFKVVNSKINKGEKDDKGAKEIVPIKRRN